MEYIAMHPCYLFQVLFHKICLSLETFKVGTEISKMENCFSYLLIYRSKNTKLTWIYEGTVSVKYFSVKINLPEWQPVMHLHVAVTQKVQILLEAFSTYQWK